MGQYLPKVSCVCPTFARAYLLEEALESFLRQDYQGGKELIICNDFPLQEFIFEHPEVKVINLPTRCPNLGSKRNVAYSYATGEYMLTWGDDDIHLPKRISRMVNAALELKSEFLLEGAHIILYAGKISYQPGLVAGPNIISKRLFEEIGGIPERNSGEDQSLNSILRKHLNKPKLDVCSNPDAQFFYRFTSPRPHISQFGFDKDGKKSGYDILLEEANKFISNGQEPSGKYVLKPHWKRDWVEDVRIAIGK
jgi:glycosyltransferase involved in cell wall biosynthesis